jgi:hypothetical protein
MWVALTLFVAPVALLLVPRVVGEFVANILAAFVGIAVWVFIIGWLIGKVQNLHDWIRR